jgi:hypothetical protein
MPVDPRQSHPYRRRSPGQHVRDEFGHAVEMEVVDVERDRVHRPMPRAVSGMLYLPPGSKGVGDHLVDL